MRKCTCIEKCHKCRSPPGKLPQSSGSCKLIKKHVDSESEKAFNVNLNLNYNGCEKGISETQIFRPPPANVPNRYSEAEFDILCNKFLEFLDRQGGRTTGTKPHHERRPNYQKTVRVKDCSTNTGHRHTSKTTQTNNLSQNLDNFVEQLITADTYKQKENDWPQKVVSSLQSLENKLKNVEHVLHKQQSELKRQDDIIFEIKHCLQSNSSSNNALLNLRNITGVFLNRYYSPSFSCSNIVSESVNQSIPLLKPKLLLSHPTFLPYSNLGVSHNNALLQTPSISFISNNRPDLFKLNPKNLPIKFPSGLLEMKIKMQQRRIAQLNKINEAEMLAKASIESNGDEGLGENPAKFIDAEDKTKLGGIGDYQEAEDNYLEPPEIKLEEVKVEKLY